MRLFHKTLKVFLDETYALDSVKCMLIQLMVIQQLFCANPTVDPFRSSTRLW